MFRQALLMMLAPAFAVAAPVPKEKEGKLYYPTAIGAKRVSARTDFRPGDRSGRASEYTEAVTKVEERDGVFTVGVEWDHGGTITSGSYRVSADGLYGMSDAADPYPLIRLSAAAGETWKRGKPGSITTTYTMGVDEEVEVPAGKFKARRVDSVVTTVTGAPGEQATHWYAPGVGVVKAAVTVAGHEVVAIELKSFTPGAGEKKVDTKPGK